MLKKVIHFFYILWKIYSRIWNKTLSFLVLFIFFLTLYFYYNFFYLPERETIKQQIKLEQEKTEVKKDTFLEKYLDEKKELSNAEKIKKLKKSKNNSFYREFENWSFLYSVVENTKIFFYLNDNFLWVFDYLWSDISVNFIYNSKNDFVLNLWEKKYLYVSDLSKFINLDFSIDILYIKKQTNNSYIFVTEKWSFVYDLNKKTFQFLSIFKDFINFENWYLWLVKREDKRVISNLWLEQYNSQIVFYNPLSKEKTLIFKSDLNLVKIYISNAEIIVTDEFWVKYKLLNIH